jgi:hypothetical protein
MIETNGWQDRIDTQQGHIRIATTWNHLHAAII